VDEETRETGEGMNRRDFLRRAAVTGAAAAWAAPVVQTIAANPAWAQSNGTPFCGHSCGAVSNGPANCDGGCMAACTFACGDTDPDCTCNSTSSDALGGPGAACGQICGAGVGEGNCAPGQGGNNPCCNSGFCNANNFDCVRDGGQVTSLEYTGPTGGCPGPFVAS
jgi:hypothetical protein